MGSGLDGGEKMQKWREAKTLMPHSEDKVSKLQNPPVSVQKERKCGTTSFAQNRYYGEQSLHMNN